MVAPGEPLWLPVDTALAVALQRLEAAQCPGCGTDQRESCDPAHEFAWRAEMVRCHACAARDRAAQAYEKAGGSTAGLMFTVTRSGGGDGRH